MNLGKGLKLKNRAVAVVFALLVGAGKVGYAQAERVVAGKTMGTTYSIKLVSGPAADASLLKQRIDLRLEEINRSMSTYRPDSEISRFNNWRRSGQPVRISNDFLQVMIAGDGIYRLSNGAWDATVAPLVVLWGFGPGGSGVQIPPDSEIQKRLKNVGFNRVRIDPQGGLIKQGPDVTLDLGSIAKGYGVDQVAALLRAEGIQNFLVEIGGEVYAAGFKNDGSPWRVGVNMPRKNAPLNQVYKVIELTDRAMATSGDYRNFFEIDGKRYSHVIDPRTGYPVANGIVSVSVEAKTCTMADGLATAIMVMGLDEGLALLNHLENAEGMIVAMKADGTLVDHYSRGHHFKEISTN